MPQHEVAIVGKNNTKAGVTGQNELLIRMGSDGVTELSEAIAAVLGTSTLVTSAVEVAAAPVTVWDAAVGFTSDAIPFTISKPWAIQISDYLIAGGAPTLTITVSVDGSTYTNYKTISTNIDISNTDNRVIFDDMFPFLYMKLTYVSGGATGSFSLKISK